ncbi:restriction endonuclease subunit S [Aliarcobacter cryaerophilus]|uniref:restriction endonuclease subunit S n=1 Tax=Aliarcobacter cryaerophilus TaxID=28198 RepID=UPI0021B54450|nr:restriction endonuclease subunit S [Aliarcobacter cryaerophilus]MCT7524453.1 restriction endonuclease subunit S [Aliarcobacter cryaerophilus]
MNQIKQGYKQTKVGIIPEDWEIVKLGKLTTVETGKTPLRSNKQFWDNGTINWATTTEVNETYIVSTNEKITNQAVAELKMKILPINTILLAMYGQGKTRGKVALLRIESTINQAFASIKPNKNYSTNFVFNYLDKSYEKIRDLSHGSNQDNLNLDIVKALQIPLPPLKEQEKIAEILTTWDEAITKQEELIKAKELQKKGLMQKLLSGEVRFSGFSDEWEEVRLSKIIKLQGGYAFKSEEFKKKGIPIIRISNISNNSNYMEMNDLIYYDELSNESNFLIKKNDLLIAMSGATTGKVSIYNLKKKAYLNQRVGLFKVIKPTLINYSFLIQFVFSNFFSVQLKSLLVAGAQPNISSKDIESLKIKLPSLPEQQKIAEVLSLVDDEINLLKNELEELKQQKKALMQKLLTGQMRVKV